jgi:hypothetical protein
VPDPREDSWSSFAEGLIGRGAGFPWREPARAPKADWERLWWQWNEAFVRAGSRLCKGILVLIQNGLDVEAKLPLRSLLELVANQGYMAREPEVRAAEFGATDLRTRSGYLDIVERLGFDQDKVDRARREIGGIRARQHDLLADFEGRDDFNPFGKKAEARIKSAGMNWHYDAVYRSTSDFVHMNAMSVANYLKSGEPKYDVGVGVGVGGPGLASLVLGCEMLLRVLYFAEAAMEQGYGDALDAHASVFGGLAYPSKDVDEAIAELRPPVVDPGA